MVEHVDDETLRGMQLLASQVRDRLAEAGLPITAELDARFSVGADVHIDPVADEVGGVYVGWRFHPSLAAQIQECVLAGNVGDPVVRRAGEVSRAMLDAIERILTAAGFAVRPTKNDMAPNNLQVLAGPS